MATPSVNVKVEVTGPVSDAYREILSAEALEFLAHLAKQFEARRLHVAGTAQPAAGGARRRQAARFPGGDGGASAQASGPSRRSRKDLEDRRVEITGPVDRKMIINALNSGANVFMADFEDSNSPTWQNNIEGQINLRDAVNGDHRLHQSGRQAVQAERQDRDAAGAAARLAPGREALLVDGKPISGSLFDFGLYFFHNAGDAAGEGHRPVFLSAQDGEPSGSAAVERRVRLRAGLRGRAARHAFAPPC